MTWSRTWEPWADVVISATVSTVSTGSDWSTERVYIRVTNNAQFGQFTSNLTFGGVVRAQQVDFGYIGATTTIYDFQHTTYRGSSGSATVNFNFKTSYNDFIAPRSFRTGTLNITLDNIPQGTTITSLSYTSDLNSASIKFKTAHTATRVRWRKGASGAWTTRSNANDFTISNYGAPAEQATLFLQAERNGVWSNSKSILITLKSLPTFTVKSGTYIGDTDTYTITGRIGTIVGSVYAKYWNKTFSTSANTGSITYTTADRQAIYEDYPDRNYAPLQRRIDVTQNGVTYRVVAARDDPKANSSLVHPSVPVFTQKDNNSFIVTNLTDNDQRFIQTYSDLQVTLTAATAVYGATIKKYIVVNGSNSKEYTSAGTYTIGKAQSNQLQVIVEDSRGIRSQLIRTLNYVEYTSPTIQNFALNREIGTSTKADLVTNGLYTSVDFGLVANKIKTVEYRKKSTGAYGGWTDITGLVLYGSGTFNNSALANIDDFTFGVEFTVEIKVSDELSFNTRTATVSKGMFTMLIDKEYGSIGIGEMPLEEENSLKVKGNVYAPNLATQTDLDLKADKTQFIQIGVTTIGGQGASSITTFSERLNNTGGKLIAQSTGIKIGAGVSKIEVSAQVYYGALGSATASLNTEIRKNGTPVCRVAKYIVTNTYDLIVFSPLIVEVEENDVFTVNFVSAGSASRVYHYDATTGERTWLLAKIIN